MKGKVVLFVPSELKGARLDAFLAHKCPDLSRSRCQQLIRRERVRVNEVVVTRPSHVLQGGEKVVVELSEPEPSAAQTEPLSVSILYEDNDLLVVNKPRGMVVHWGAGVQSGTLVDALLTMGKVLSNIAGAERPGIVHRLDKGTSGVMVVAKTNEAHLHLARQFAERRVDKRYLAIIVGEPPFEHRVVEAALSRHPKDPEHFVVAAKTSPNAVEAITEIWVRERLDGFALVEAKPITGRTHQIRVHLQYLGFPVVGDEEYKGRTKAFQLAQKRKEEALLKALTTLSGQALHAWRLCFRHPRTEECLSFEAPLPEDMKALLQLLQSRKGSP